MRFRDVHVRTLGHHLPPKSRLIHFYSSNDNIGNYLPVAAIRKMIHNDTDTWCIHRPVDFDYVNTRYAAAIVGGAGLFYRCFNRFWLDLERHCQIPVIIWGVGVCMPDGVPPSEAAVDMNAVSNVCKRAVMVNVRDHLTAEYYGLEDAHISVCPTVEYLAGWPTKPSQGRVTLAMHPNYATDHEHQEIADSLTAAGWFVQRTTNVQTWRRGVDQIVALDYATSAAVVTTRLHGAIVAYGLGIPYVALARDEKIREFHRLAGGGVLIETTNDAQDALGGLTPTRPDLSAVHAFAARAVGWLRGNSLV